MVVVDQEHAVGHTGDDHQRRDHRHEQGDLEVQQADEAEGPDHRDDHHRHAHPHHLPRAEEQEEQHRRYQQGKAQEQGHLPAHQGGHLHADIRQAAVVQLQSLRSFIALRALQNALHEITALLAVEFRRVHEHHHQARLRPLVEEQAAVKRQRVHARHQRVHLRRRARRLGHHGHDTETHQRVIAEQGEQVRLAEHRIHAIDPLQVPAQGAPRAEGLRRVKAFTLHAHHHHIAVLAELLLEVRIGHVGTVGPWQQSTVLVAHPDRGGLVAHEHGDKTHGDEDRQSIPQYAACQPVPHRCSGG